MNKKKYPFKYFYVLRKAKEKTATLNKDTINSMPINENITTKKIRIKPYSMGQELRKSNIKLERKNTFRNTQTKLFRFVYLFKEISLNKYRKISNIKHISFSSFNLKSAIGNSKKIINQCRSKLEQKRIEQTESEGIEYTEEPFTYTLAGFLIVFLILIELITLIYLFN